LTGGAAVDAVAGRCGFWATYRLEFVGGIWEAQGLEGSVHHFLNGSRPTV